MMNFTIVWNRFIYTQLFDHPKILSVANLSCYECDECLFDDNTKCTNSEYCGVRRVLQMEYMNRKERDSNDYMYENESVSDLVTIGSVVAVLADDDQVHI
jgi:hypothetical protein